MSNRLVWWDGIFCSIKAYKCPLVEGNSKGFQNVPFLYFQGLQDVNKVINCHHPRRSWRLDGCCCEAYCRVLPQWVWKTSASNLGLCRPQLGWWILKSVIGHWATLSKRVASLFGWVDGDSFILYMTACYLNKELDFRNDVLWDQRKIKPNDHKLSSKSTTVRLRENGIKVGLRTWPGVCNLSNPKSHFCPQPI